MQAEQRRCTPGLRSTAVAGVAERIQEGGSGVGEGRRETNKGGFPGPRLPVSNVQVPKFSLRSAGPLGIGESGVGTLGKYLSRILPPISLSLSSSPRFLFLLLPFLLSLLPFLLLAPFHLPSVLINMYVHAQ